MAGVKAIASADGALEWTFSAGKPIHGAAAIDVDAVHSVCDDGYLCKLARGDGRLLWRYTPGDAAVSRIPCIRRPATGTCFRSNR